MWWLKAREGSSVFAQMFAHLEVKFALRFFQDKKKWKNFCRKRCVKWITWSSLYRTTFSLNLWGNKWKSRQRRTYLHNCTHDHDKISPAIIFRSWQINFCVSTNSFKHFLLLVFNRSIDKNLNSSSFATFRFYSFRWSIVRWWRLSFDRIWLRFIEWNRKLLASSSLDSIVN